MILIKSLKKFFAGSSIPAIDNISVQILSGRITGIVGPDGAGKTTLIRLIAGLLEPSEGNISVFGYDSVKETPAIREIMGYMPQRFGLYEDLTVIENLKLYAEIRGLEKSEQKNRFDELLQFTNLEPFAMRISGRLSGGMKQKLGLACSLIKMPKLLLLDEPGVGVDPISRRELWRMIRELITHDVIAVWNTAYLDEAEACDDVLLLNRGKQLFHGKPENLTQKIIGRVVSVSGLTAGKRRKFLARIIQEPETLDGTVQGNAIRVVLKAGISPQQLNVQKLIDESDKVEIVPVKPRFEDGFIDILGGTVKRESALAQRKIKLANDDKPVVIAHNLTKRYGTFTAVRNNNFEIKRGEIFGLLGPNGAGKSTIFRMLCGLIKPTEGEGFIAGYNLNKSPSRARSRLGYMAQKFSMYGELTVRQNLNFFAGVYGLWGFAKRKAINNVIEIFDLEQYASINASLLPLGFKQRLSLAAALMHEPDVLFLDEPTSGVDPITRREFWSHINALVESGITILVTTHFMDEAEYCDRIALMYNGETITTGTPDDLKLSVKNSTSIINPTLEDAFIILIEKMENAVSG
ncbi:MAG: ATP-binding cassette domain-containing protein [Planctomycetaceae bacterium]|jgi:ABC-2 type transport system ATP-binding protein|nr:ATP-binding cassette domain-containing protein [Planctomycetaceae bacterium]